MKLVRNLFLSSIVSAGSLTVGYAQSVQPAITPDPQIEANIQQWLKKMTLEEKIGQMCEITIDVVTDFEESRKKGFTLSSAKLDTCLLYTSPSPRD